MLVFNQLDPKLTGWVLKMKTPFAPSYLAVLEIFRCIQFKHWFKVHRKIDWMKNFRKLYKQDWIMSGEKTTTIQPYFQNILFISSSFGFFLTLIFLRKLFLVSKLLCRRWNIKTRNTCRSFEQTITAQQIAKYD